MGFDTGGKVTIDDVHHNTIAPLDLGATSIGVETNSRANFTS